MKIKRMIRQGDVLVLSVDKGPKAKAKEAAIERGTLTLALGEATGHHHSFFATGADTLTRSEDVIAELTTSLRKAGILTEDWAVDAHVNLSAEQGLQHQEHSTITHQKGDHVVIRQREYSPGEIRRVAD